MSRRLRVMTANLLCVAGARGAAVARLLEEREVDVLACQELAPEQAGAIAEVLPHGKLEPTREYLGMGIALRHPGEVQRLSLPERDARRVELDPSAWPGLERAVEVVNVHLRAPHMRPFRTSWSMRREQGRRLARYLGEVPHPSRLVLGDFNATPLWPLYRRASAGLEDAARIHAGATGGRPQPTWGPWPGSRRLLRIDHAFVRGLQVHHLEVVPVEGSDHSALLLEIRPGSPRDPRGS